MKRLTQVYRYLYIVVTYNGSSWIETFIDGSVGVPHANFLVVDNASTDNTLEKLKYNYPDVKVISKDCNLGFGQANNIGMSYALTFGYEYVILLNQDASLSEDSLNKILSADYNGSANGILTPLHFFREGELDQGFDGYLGDKCSLENLPDSPFEVPFVNAAIWVFSNAILQTVGGFDPDFYHYGEDQDFVRRARYHGFPVMVIPTAKGFHRRLQIVGEMQLAKIPVQVKNRGYYLAKDINTLILSGYLKWYRTFLPRFFRYGLVTRQVSVGQWLRIWIEVNWMFIKALFTRHKLKRKGTTFLPTFKNS